MKCDSCAEYFTARDTPEYCLLKRGGQPNKRFCSVRCLWIYVSMVYHQREQEKEPIQGALEAYLE